MYSDGGIERTDIHKVLKSNEVQMYMHPLDYKIATLIQMDVTLNGICIYYL